MLSRADYKRESHVISDWIENYFRNLPDLPVKSPSKPGQVLDALPNTMPTESESIEAIMQDLDEVIIPGMTHWQHPGFHAYFPANSSVESLLAEQVTAAIGAQCMIWETSPAAAELEQRMMEWLRDAMHLPAGWEGVIQDSASTATLVAILTAREFVTDFSSNDKGVPPGLRVYCSDQTHSSIDKAVGIAGIGRHNLLKIPVDHQLGIRADKLEEAILSDIEKGKKPCCVILTIGTTSTLAIDNIEEIGPICQRHGVWLHVDAAYAGTGLLLPEFRWMMNGSEYVDSFVFNPHKWMFTNFDCSVYFVRDRSALLKTFEILPEYLRTSTRGLVNDYRDWGVPLGRRFRALKLWFVIRSYGLKGLQSKLRSHISLNDYFAVQIATSNLFTLAFQPRLNFTSFRFEPRELTLEIDDLNILNSRLLSDINESGKIFLTHTKVDGRIILRMVIGQTYIEKENVDLALELLHEHARKLIHQSDNT